MVLRYILACIFIPTGKNPSENTGMFIWRSLPRFIGAAAKNKCPAACCVISLRSRRLAAGDLESKAALKGQRQVLFSIGHSVIRQIPRLPDVGIQVIGAVQELSKLYTAEAGHSDSGGALHFHGKTAFLPTFFNGGAGFSVNGIGSSCFSFYIGADNLSSDTWEIRDLMSYGLTNAEKYMVLAFECGLAM